MSLLHASAMFGALTPQLFRYFAFLLDPPAPAALRLSPAPAFGFLEACGVRGEQEVSIIGDDQSRVCGTSMLALA